ncbi:hypothetical protein [Chitinimonas sp. JJ19]|uniref:hypothetical protein n=1 Tax=Chitinimonas sp. JJ19 TaxID=3109352 RepID=UPI00300230B8
MFDRLLPIFQTDTPLRELRLILERLPGQPVIAALDGLAEALREGMAASPSGPAARKLIDALDPTARQWADQALEELATNKDNPVRRDMTGKRLALLADQLANASYIEAVRETVQLQKGTGRIGDLRDWAAGYLHWLGLAHTARALYDPQQAAVIWAGPVDIYLALVRHGVLGSHIGDSKDEPARALAYLLLSHDAFAVVEGHEVALAARCCRQLAGHVFIAPDFHRSTPLVMDPDANEASRLVGWGGPSAASPALCFGLEAVAQQARYAQSVLQTGGLLDWLPANAQPEVFDKLVHGWVARSGRCPNIVASRLGQLQTAFDFLRIRGLLGQKNERMLENDPYLRRAQVEDIDENGVGLLLPGDSAALLAAGLLALQMPGRGWWLARPVRSLPQADGLLFVTARWLGQEAQAIRLIPVTGDGQRALYLQPGPANGYEAIVLLDHDWLATDLPCQAELGESSLTLVPAAPEPLGPALWCYRCRQV